MFAPFGKEGTGLHSGTHSEVVVEMGLPGSGVVFVVGEVAFEVTPTSIAAPVRLATVISHQGIRVSTVEHLFSALNAYGETDVRISVNGPEVPILDGSALPWAEELEANGALMNPHFLSIPSDVTISIGDSQAKVTPLAQDEVPSIRVVLEFDGSKLNRQEFTYFPLSDNYIRELAPARTFAFESDVEAIQAAGLGRGGSLNNALVIGSDGPLNENGLRFSNEPARHKLLDALGDLLIIGGIPWAKIELARPGHALLHALIKHLQTLRVKQCSKYPGDQR